MLWITLAIAIIVLICAFIEIFYEHKILVGIILLIIALVVGGLSIWGISSAYKHTEYEALDTTQEIVSIKDDSQVSGSGGRFYVFINTEGVYTYYYKLEDGGYKQGKLSADNTIIYEEDDCKTPSVQVYKKYTQDNFNETWTKILIFSSKQDKYVIFSTRYEIHVPKGTIVQEFVLDAE